MNLLPFLLKITAQAQEMGAQAQSTANSTLVELADTGSEVPPSFMERYNLLIMMILVFGVMYLFMIRPQQKKQKEMVKFRSALEKGDKVITAGGIYGTIKEVKDTYVLLEVDNGVSIRVEKSMISQAPDPSAQPKK